MNADPTKVRLEKELKHTSPLISCRIEPSGRFVFAGGQDSSIQRWEIASGKKTPFLGHKSWVRAFTFHAKEKWMIAGDYQGRLIWWPLEADKPTPIRKIDAHRGWVRAVAISPDGKTIASCGNDHLVKLWSAADGKLLHQLTGHSCHVYNVAFHPTGKFLVSADLKGVIKHWDLAKNSAVRELSAKALHLYDKTFEADIGGIRGMAFNAAGTLLACGGITDVTNAFAGVGKPLVVLLDWQTGKVKQMLRPKDNFQGTTWGVGFLGTGTIVGVGGGNGGALWFWKPEQPQSFHTLKLAQNARDLDLHPDGRRLAIPFYDRTVRIYDMGPKKA